MAMKIKSKFSEKALVENMRSHCWWCHQAEWDKPCKKLGSPCKEKNEETCRILHEHFEHTQKATINDANRIRDNPANNPVKMAGKEKT